MDHISAPSQPYPHTERRIPYLAQFKPRLRYDYLGFHDFPSRKRFDVDEWIDGRFRRTTTYDDALALLQSWLFFGLLIETLKEGDIAVRVDDFLEPAAAKHGDSSYISNKKLLQVSKRWEVNIAALTEDSRKQKCETVRSYLRSAREVYSRIESMKEYEGEPGAPHCHLFRPAQSDHCPCSNALDVCELCSVADDEVLHASLIIAADLLDTWSSYFLDDAPRFSWSPSRYLRWRLLKSGWCRREVHMLIGQGYGPSTIFYLGSTNRQAVRAGHETWMCTENECITEQLDKRRYRTRHADLCPQDKTCFELVFETPWNRRLSGLVKAGQTPVITVTETSERPSLHVSILSAQGTIQNGGDKPIELSSERRAVFYGDCSIPQTTRGPGRYVAISHVWSDGMGNPKRNGLPKCQLLRIQGLVNDLYPDSTEPIPFWIDTVCVPLQPSARSSAIKAMRFTYKQADKVLVLDNTLSSLEKGTTAVEMFARVMSSSWTRRLWTFQEAALAKSLHYQLSDVAMTSREMWHHCCQNFLLDNPHWSEPTSTVPLATTRGSRDKDYHYASDEEMRTRASWLDPVLQQTFSAVQDLEDFADARRANPEFGQDTIEYRDAYDLEVLSGPLRWRKTTRMEDETICLCGILDRPVDDLVGLRGEERMKKFLGSFKGVPTSILFQQTRSRLQAEGCRWMPSSFLGSENEVISLTEGYSIPTPEGLKVQSPGILLSPDWKQEDEQGRGKVNVEIFGQDFYLTNDGSDMDEYGVPDDWWGTLVRKEMKEIGIILRYPIEVILDEGLQGCPAVIVTMEKSKQQDGACRRCRLEYVTMLYVDDPETSMWINDPVPSRYQGDFMWLLR